MLNHSDVIVDDIIAWETYPQHRWMLNKLFVLDSLGIQCGPVGVVPPKFPVIVKPIINPQGMGAGSYKAHNEEQMDRSNGMMWMPYYTGEHKSWDICIENNKVIDLYTAIGYNPPYFTQWFINSGNGLDFDLAQQHVDRLSEIGPLPKYFNIETVGNNIIECHPRWAEEWIEHYDRVPFTQHILWNSDIRTPPPGGWIDCRIDSSNFHLNKYKRIAYSIQYYGG